MVIPHKMETRIKLGKENEEVQCEHQCTLDSSLKDQMWFFFREIKYALMYTIIYAYIIVS